MRLIEGEQEDVNCSRVSVALGMMGAIWDCLLSSLTTMGTTVGFPTLESQLSTEGLTVAELASDTALSGRMGEMQIH